MIFLRRARIRLGSTAEEVVAAAARCNRDAQAEACTPENFADELGGPELVVDSFWLDRTEVSLGQYEHCVRQGRCRALPYENGAMRFERPELPAVFVNYQEAHEYCAQRGARLPTEAELERAARGPTGRRYPWGEQFHAALANHGRWGVSQTEPRDGHEELAPVEAYVQGRTPEGVLQLAGNVAEWTSTPYGPYSATEPPDPSAPRVVRGGHYLTGPAWLRGAARLHEPPHRRAAFLGFRCARSYRDDSAS
jgi:formylglycine-generating enzyme required for sulfatase activity